MKNQNNSILKFYIREMIREMSSLDNKLYVFDFDDTLVKTDALVGITDVSTGDKKWLTPGQYATHEKADTEHFDFSQFDDLINPKSISWTKRILKNVYDKRGPGATAVLTARGHESNEKIQNFLNSLGLTGIEIITLGSSNPQDKADWIEQQINSRNLTEVEFFDDSHKNVSAVAKLKQKYPNIKIISRHIVHKKQF